MVEVGESPPVGGLDKQKLLIGALVIGGGIGLFVFLRRKSAAPSDTAENKAQTDILPNTLTLAYQNLAEQLLGFRGDVSVANANMAQGEQDILSSIGTESANRASSDQNLMAAIWQTFVRASNPNADWDYLMNQNPYLAHDPNAPYVAPGTVASTPGNSPYLPAPPIQSGSPVNPAPTGGAGGATPRDAILAAIGANDDGDYYMAHLSSGPVRHVSGRSY